MVKVLTAALWGTGAQVLIASHERIARNSPDIKINPAEDLIEDNLNPKIHPTFKQSHNTSHNSCVYEENNKGSFHNHEDGK